MPGNREPEEQPMRLPEEAERKQIISDLTRKGILPGGSPPLPVPAGIGPDFGMLPEIPAHPVFPLPGPAASGDRAAHGTPGKPAETSPNRPKHDVAEIFRLCGEKYRRTHRLTPQQASVMSDIETCRTAVFGHHADVCEECGNVEIQYNSCHNRHCPKCQGAAKRKWVNARLNELMPIPYYHAVFTLPNMIFPLCMYNQRLTYDLLFESAAETLKAFGRDPRWLGAEIGFYGILHTWGQTMWLHPHLHLIVTGGGLNGDGEWVSPEYGGRFLFPVRAVSKVFRGKFIQKLKKAYYDGDLTIPDEKEELRIPHKFEQHIDRTAGRKWVVHTKAPFAGPEEVVRYIGRYTHRVAISNYRILSVKDGKVTFSYKDYKDGGKKKTMTLTAEEFTHRFLLHVLPERFHRIRHYGILANNRARKTAEKVRELLKDENGTGENTGEAADTPEKREPEEDFRPVCPVCGKGRMVTVLVLHPFYRTVVRGDLMHHLTEDEPYDSS